MKKLLLLPAALLALYSGPVLAAHGKAGLWNVSTTTDAAMNIPPEAAAQMKAMGIKMPTAHTIATQICMTQAQVESDKPPEIGRNQTGCTTRLLSQTAAAMKAEMVCDGAAMKGTGQIEVSYNGTEHYAGSYDFKGTMDGHPANMRSRFSGDWVKADCGTVKPFQSPH
jgi:hypothetical protein